VTPGAAFDAKSESQECLIRLRLRGKGSLPMLVVIGRPGEAVVI
jgi:hypothetical protein